MITQIRAIAVFVTVMAIPSHANIDPKFELGLLFSPYLYMGELEFKKLDNSLGSWSSPTYIKTNLSNYYKWLPGLSASTKLGQISEFALSFDFQYYRNSSVSSIYDESSSTLLNLNTRYEIYKLKGGLEYSYNRNQSHLKCILSYLRIWHDETFYLDDNDFGKSNEFIFTTYEDNGLGLSISYLYDINQTITANLALDIDYTREFPSISISPGICIDIWRNFSTVANISYDVLNKSMQFNFGILYNYSFNKSR